VSDHKRDAGEQMVHDTGSAPAIDVRSDQRAELLQEWHRRDAEADAERHEAEKEKKREA
jgi:hypothetical protein